MITLKSVAVNKYKCIETEQRFDIEPDTTVLVGKNESGKTATLEAIHMSNSYLNERFNSDLDFPKKEKKSFDRSRTDVTVVTCAYSLTDRLTDSVRDDIGEGTLVCNEVVHSTSYERTKGRFEPLHVDTAKFFDHKFEKHDIGNNLFKSKVLDAKSVSEIEALRGRYKSGKIKGFLDDVSEYLEYEDKIDDSLGRYVIEAWIDQYLPKFLYYDEYYELPSEVSLREIESGNSDDKKLRTARALFELADINIKQLDNENNYEVYKSELEATAVDITLRLLEYWKTNSNLRVEFDIYRLPDDYSNAILKIRVFNNKYMMSLPLGSRSRGFNWFFSFLVWFSKIQVERDSRYILLLDEPGLNLHASAQSDLLRFIEVLAKDYQVVYSTHSPFMVESDKLHRVRTVLETDTGTRISDSVQEKDPDTLFPLQAALGYDIAQNLFIGKNNLLIEGTSDLVTLQVMSSILEGASRTGLREDITLVPVGGLDKVSTFISLLRGQKLDIACLLDTFTDQKGKQRVDDLIRDKIIRERNIRFFDEFSGNGSKYADLEDMFEKAEYLSIFNQAFAEHSKIEVKDLDANEHRIVKQIENILGKRYNHHRPANLLARLGVDANCFCDETLNRFEKMFEEINKLFKK